MCAFGKLWRPPTGDIWLLAIFGDLLIIDDSLLRITRRRSYLNNDVCENYRVSKYWPLQDVP